MRATNSEAQLAISEVKQQVDSQLAKIYEEYIASANQIEASYGQLLISMQEFIERGGKRLRPYLTYLGYYGLAGDNNPAIIKVAAAQELLHNFLLIHDDIIDRDESRYHGPNISGVYYNQFLGNHSEAEALHYGRSVALLAGDINHLLTHKVIIDSGFEGDHKLQALNWLTQKTFEVIGGEFLDLTVSVEPGSNATKAQLLSVARYKTASYSFECPLVIGALLAGANQADTEALSQFALPLGIAYQLQDDMLGVFGDPSSTGKSITSDLAEGKQTLLMHYGFEYGDSQQVDVLEAVYGRPDLKESDVKKVRYILEENGAADAVREEIKDYSHEALESIPSSLSPSVGQELEQLLDSLVDRTR